MSDLRKKIPSKKRYFIINNRANKLFFLRILNQSDRSIHQKQQTSSSKGRQIFEVFWFELYKCSEGFPVKSHVLWMQDNNKLKSVSVCQ